MYMKKLLPFVVCFLLAVSIVTAREDTPGVEPDSLLHGLDIAMEKMRLVFTFSNAKRAELHVKYAAERLAEARAMANKGKNDLVEKSIGKYHAELENTETELENAKARGEKIDSVVGQIDKVTKRNIVVLTTLLDKVPETAKKGIQNALDKAQKGRAKALEAVGKSEEKEEEKVEKKEEKKEEINEKKTEKQEEKEEKMEEKAKKKEETTKEASEIDPSQYSYTVKKFSDHAEVAGKVAGRDVKFRIEADQYGSDASLKLRIVREVKQQYSYDEEDAQNAMANLKIETGVGKPEIPLVKKKKGD